MKTSFFPKKVKFLTFFEKYFHFVLLLKGKL